jgi:hypothetical protein
MRRNHMTYSSQEAMMAALEQKSTVQVLPAISADHGEQPVIGIGVTQSTKLFLKASWDPEEGSIQFAMESVEV